MPTPRNEGHRLRAGAHPVVDITSSYALVSLAVQSDQKQNGVTVVPWVAPYQALPPQYARIVIAADGTAKGDGFMSGVLPFDYWTFGMIALIKSTFFSGGVLSAPASMMLYDDSDTAVYLNSTLYYPVRNDQFQDYEPFPGGWESIKLRYGFGTIIS